jgi:murein DD-endopeptidase MepM/ murein hydrolase activator NlpD
MILLFSQYTYLKGIMGGKHMDKDSMPKLELDGFTYEIKKITKTPESPQSPVSLAAKAEKFARSSVERIKKLRSAKAPAAGFSRNEPDLKYRRLLIKTGTCAVIAVVILGIASINTQDANSLSQAINSTVNHQFNMDEDIGRLKFVDNLNDETESVFSPLPDSAAVYPADKYDIVTTFGQAGSQGVRIKPVGTQIVNIARGTVVNVGKINDNEYVEVKFDTGETAFYYGITPSVKVNDIVKAGQAIGDVEYDYLYLEIKKGDTYIDPMAYIEQREAAEASSAS